MYSTCAVEDGVSYIGMKRKLKASGVLIDQRKLKTLNEAFIYRNWGRERERKKKVNYKTNEN